MTDILPGAILIADPFLKDPNFLRTTVFVCDYNPQGCVGFVINRKEEAVVGDLVEGLEDCNFPVYYGGPVELNTLHFLHCCPELITGGIEVTKGIFWGGNFEELKILLQNKWIRENQLRFFMGYSGWSEGQLQEELNEKSWLTTNGNPSLVFHDNTTLIWKEAIKQLGGEYLQLINYPIDPQLN